MIAMWSFLTLMFKFFKFFHSVFIMFSLLLTPARFFPPVLPNQLYVLSLCPEPTKKALRKTKNQNKQEKRRIWLIKVQTTEQNEAKSL